MRMNRLNLDLSSTVWFSTLPPGINKLVLLAYCLHVNDHTGLCWPSVGRIAALTGMSPRTVQRHIRALEAAGILKARPTTNATRVYQLALDGLPLCPALTKPVADVQGDIFDTDPRQSVQQGVAICTETPDRMSPKQVLTERRTDEGTEHAAPAPELPAFTAPPSPQAMPPASPASRSSALPPVVAQQEKTKAEDQTQALARFAALHQRKGYGPVTDATLDKLKAEGELAGLTLPQVVTHCVERRWGTFRAAWLTPKPSHRHGPTLAPHSAHPAPAMPGDGGWGLARDARASATPQRLSPDGELAARKLAAFEASRNAPPAAPEQVATHRAKLAALRASYVAGGASPARAIQPQPVSAARVAMH